MLRVGMVLMSFIDFSLSQKHLNSQVIQKVLLYFVSWFLMLYLGVSSDVKGSILGALDVCGN